MIHRPKSFSKGGANIDRVMQIERYDIDPLTLKTLLAPKLNPRQSSPKPKAQPFEQITGRTKPSPFLISQIKDANTHLEYQDRRKIPNKVLPVKKEKGERLSGLFAKAKKSQEEQELCDLRRVQSCKKYDPYSNEAIKTARDLNPRKTMHNFDFTKQTQRPFDESLKKISVVQEQRLERAQSTGALLMTVENNSFDKKEKVHSFGSYTGRDFLTHNRVKGAPETSGADWYKVDPEKFKGHWKTVRGVSLKGVNHCLTKYDRDCPHWFTTLNYNVKREKEKGQVTFNKQTPRMDNTVQSAYPIRLAI